MVTSLCPIVRNIYIDPKGYSLFWIIICFKVFVLKWEGSTLLSSLEFKNRVITKSFFSTLSLNRDFIDRSSSLLKNWDSTSQWSSDGLVLDEDGVATPHPDGIVKVGKAPLPR